MTEKEWQSFCIPYEQTMQELIVKFQNMISEYQSLGLYSPVEQVTGRVKSFDSVTEKMKRMEITEADLEDRMTDIAGIRLICRFVEDIDTVVKIVRGRKDMEVIEETNYIDHQKESGYRSYHMIISYPVYTVFGRKNVKAEIQIRTLGMNFWCTIEHSLSYKYKGKVPKDVTERLQRASEAAFDMDKEMSSIRDEIMNLRKG